MHAHTDFSVYRPLGLLYIAACLEREGHTVHVIDPQPSDSVAKVTEAVLRREPDLVGFSCLTPGIYRALDIATEIKERWQVPIVFGGVHPTVCPTETLEYECVDYIVIGEGEETMCELCQKLSNSEPIYDVRGIGYKKDEKSYLTPARPLIDNLDKLPFPARHLMPSEWYNQPKIRGVTSKTEIVMTGRGCLWNCAFCSSRLMWHKKVRRRSPENVIRELELLRTQCDINSIWFVDDTFTINPNWVRHFCDLLGEKNWKNFIWACQARVDTVNKEILSKMKSAGCIQVEYGVESGSEKVLKLLRKGITPKQVKRAFRVTKEVGLRALATFIIDVPGETLTDIKETEKLIKEIRPDYYDVFFAIPYPGTELYQLTSASIKKVPYDQLVVENQFERNPVICANFGEEELVEIRNRLLSYRPTLSFRAILHPRYVERRYYVLTKFLGGLKRLGTSLGLKKSLVRRVDSWIDEIYKHHLEKRKPQLQ